MRADAGLEVCTQATNGVTAKAIANAIDRPGNRSASFDPVVAEESGLVSLALIGEAGCRDAEQSYAPPVRTQIFEQAAGRAEDCLLGRGGLGKRHRVSTGLEVVGAVFERDRSSL